ncbi:type II secretion system F family protein [bacterium]|nr:type II secretion system F family protein [bacterium]
MFEWMIPIIIFIAVFMLVYAFQTVMRAARLRRHAMVIADMADQKDDQAAKQRPLEKLFFRSLPVMAAGQKKMVPVAWGIGVEKNLAILPKWSGRPAAEWLVVKELSFIGGLLFGSALGAGGVYTFLIAGVAFFLPDLWLREKNQARRKGVMRELPDTLDLLASCMEAGLGFEQAVGIILERSQPGYLYQELSEMMRAIRMGLSRRDALKGMGERVDDSDFTTFVTALIQAEKLGVSVAVILKQQAEQLRIKRSQLIEKQALEAPIKLLFPLIIFIFPVVFIILFGPIVIRFMQGF